MILYCVLLLGCSLSTISCADTDRYQPRWTWKKGLGTNSPPRVHQPDLYEDRDLCHEYNMYFGDNTNTSASFGAALKDYQRMLDGLVHSRQDGGLAPVLHRYIRQPEDITERFLIFRVENPTIGLGNRLLGLVSSFLLAMLTQRIFLVDFEDYRAEDLLCNPLQGFPWTFTGSWSKIASTFPGEPLPAEDIDHLSGTFGKLAILRISEKPRDEPALWSLVTEPDLARKWSQVHILQVSSNQYFIPLLFGNAGYRSQLQSWFPAGQVATTLVRHLVRPRPFIWRQVERHLGPLSDPTVGLQFRSFAAGFRVEDFQNALTCLESLQATARPRVLLASLYPECSELIRLKHPVWNVTHPHADKVQQPGLPQAIRTLHDIILLSLSQRHLIVSPRSTLGYLASAFRATASWYLSHRDKACHLAMSPEPCLHGSINKGIRWRGFFSTQRINVTLPDGTVVEQRLYVPCEDTDGYKLNNL